MKDEYCHCGKVLTQNNRWLHVQTGCFDVPVVRIEDDGVSAVDGKTEGAAVSVQSEHLGELGKKQRWDRDKYNAYMRANRHKWKR